MKPTKKAFISEDSGSPFLKSAQLKHNSNPIELFKTEARKFDVPIRMTRFDDSSSITISEENNGITPSENADFQKFMHKCNPNRKIEVKYSLSKETDDLKDSSEYVLPSVRETLIQEKRSSCKNIPGTNHFTLGNHTQHKFHPNLIQEKLNKEREMKYLKNVAGSSIGFDHLRRLEINDFKAPRKSSCGRFDIHSPMTPVQMKTPKETLPHEGLQIESRDEVLTTKKSKPRKLSSIGRDFYNY